MADAPALRLTGVVKRFADARAVNDVTLEVRRGELVALLGPSGCGKTTLLRCIAGLERPDAGTIEVHGREVVGAGGFVAAERRNVGMVFQDYALFPHLSVLGNVEYGLPGRGRSRTARAARRATAMEALGLVGLGDLAARGVDQLSGGQQQRVALARALAPEPELILLDEPFSNLDAALRQSVRMDVREILRAADATAIIVTHDQEEALSLADRVAVMREGQVHQVADPVTLYRHPATAFVAQFVGDADVVDAVARADGRLDSDFGLLVPMGGPLGASAGERVQVAVRPEEVVLEADARSAHRVEQVQYFGHDQLLHVRMADGRLVRSRLGPAEALEVGDRVVVRVETPVAAFGAWERMPVAA